MIENKIKLGSRLLFKNEKEQISEAIVIEIINSKSLKTNNSIYKIDYWTGKTYKVTTTNSCFLHGVNMFPKDLNTNELVELHSGGVTL